MTNNNLASILSKNNADEQSAIEGYFQLLTMNNLPSELIKDIQEIISDEMNHSKVLSGWVSRLTGIQPNKT